MTVQPSGKAHAQLSHGHSRLIWLLDDIDAHLEGLCSENESPELILEELVSYVRAFGDELDGHIDEEETDIFPQAAAVATEPERRELAEIEEEHRRLEERLARFWSKLAQLCEAPPDRYETCCVDLVEQARELRVALTAHSSHERDFLTRVEPRITDEHD
jgi:iron-sulfur cluster repair protein YtfE (RIC family)